MLPAIKMMEQTTTRTQDGLRRLDNWARWGSRGELAILSAHFFAPKAAVCGNYLQESGDVWGDREPSLPVDEKDAILVERLVLALPIQLKKAVTHFYFGRPRTIGISEYTLREWMEQAARRIS